MKAVVAIHFLRTQLRRGGAERLIKCASSILPLKVLVLVVSGPDWSILQHPKSSKGLVMQEFGNKVLHAMTINEPRIVQLYRAVGRFLGCGHLIKLKFRKLPPISKDVQGAARTAQPGPKS